MKTRSAKLFAVGAAVLLMTGIANLAMFPERAFWAYVKRGNPAAPRLNLFVLLAVVYAMFGLAYYALGKSGRGSDMLGSLHFWLTTVSFVTVVLMSLSSQLISGTGGWLVIAAIAVFLLSQLLFVWNLFASFLRGQRS